MLTFPLDPTDDSANPAFKNAASCVQWLRQLQLTNLQLAHQQLLTQINELNRYPMQSSQRLGTLEELRETVAHVQSSYAAKLIGKPLPLIQEEFLVFVALIQLWQAMLSGYQRCLQDYLSGNHELNNHAALLCQRCLLYSGQVVFEHLRAGYEFDGKLWQQLHALYELAETREFAHQEITDPLLGEHPNSSCHRIYVKVLLACYARPSELSRAQLQLLDNWLSEWSNTVIIEFSYVDTHRDAQPLAIDLSSTQGLRPAQQLTPGEKIRYLATVPLSKSLRVNTILLEQGKTPQQLKLGNSSNSKDCIRFLNFLHQCWCENFNTRSSERQLVSHFAELCYQAENIYAHICRESFKQPTRDIVAHTLALKQTEVLGRAVQGEHNKEKIELEFPLETWHIENESILGAQLTREQVQGKRVCSGQLVAARLIAHPTFSLASIAWVNVLRSGQLRIGIKYLPGTVQGIGIRTTGLGSSDKYAPAFSLGAMTALKIPASLIIPRNWFQPERIVDILQVNGERIQVKLGFVVERGMDFERVSFKLI